MVIRDYADGDVVVWMLLMVVLLVLMWFVRVWSVMCGVVVSDVSAAAVCRV